MKEKLIAEYSNVGHPQYPEDTWDWEREISNVNDLFQFMKDIHRTDAYHFNDFPLIGGCSMGGFKFVIEKSIILDGETFVGNRKQVEQPTYFNEAKEMYEKFYKRLHTTLPNLRKAKAIRDKKNYELSQLEYLKSKYQ
jgi:hypothetical protein